MSVAIAIEAARLIPAANDGLFRWRWGRPMINKLRVYAVNAN